MRPAKLLGGIAIKLQNGPEMWITMDYLNGSKLEAARSRSQCTYKVIFCVTVYNMNTVSNQICYVSLTVCIYHFLNYYQLFN